MNDNHNDFEVIIECEGRATYLTQHIATTLRENYAVRDQESAVDDVVQTLSIVETAAAICAVALAMAHLAYQISRDNIRTWTKKRLVQHLATELAAKGVTGYHIAAIENFDNFRNGQDLCRVDIAVEDGTTIRVWLFLDGSIALLKIETS